MEAQNKLMGIQSVTGIKLVFSEYACDPKYELVNRSWKERLFTRPWIPLRKHKLVMTALNPKMFRINTTDGEMIVAHPSLKEQLRNLTLRRADPPAAVLSASRSRAGGSRDLLCARASCNANELYFKSIGWGGFSSRTQ